MKEFFLTQGKVTFVDDENYEELSKYNWYAWKNQQGDFYAVRSSWQKAKKTCHRVYMHREILELGRGDKRQGDHRNHNTLDNRQDNLRICSQRQNQMNQKSHPNTSSRFKGVIWDRFNKKWKAQISINGITKSLGFWKLEEVAALAYDMVAIREHGEFAVLNFN